MGKIIVEADSQQITIGRMRIACWIPKAANTHSEYVTLIAFPLQQWLHERAPLLRYTYMGPFLKYILAMKLESEGLHG